MLSSEGRRYKKTAGYMANLQGAEQLDGEVVVLMRFFRPRRGDDLDNRLKACLDCLKGIAWKDDRQVKRIEAERFEDPQNPRVEVTIEEVPKA